MNRRRALKIVRKHLRPPYHRYPWRTWSRVLRYMDQRKLAYYDRQFWPLEAVTVEAVTTNTTSQPQGLYQGVYADE